MSGSTPGDDAGSGSRWNPFSMPSGRRDPEQSSWGDEHSSASWGSGSPERAGHGAPHPPRQLVLAVRLMYIGAAIFGLNLLFFLVNAENIRTELRESLQTEDELGVEQLESQADTIYASGVGMLIVGILLWLWMARANKRGRYWARIVATILGGMYIIFALFSLLGALTLASVITAVTIAIAASALVLMYRPESSEYYRAMSPRVY
ncbi:hypothetical protein EF847_20740 [Actinobacteria bacterium YIM 96077]|uniref:Uncharacterized protein n=1 Tax=Phytoactinopolyspora halophila TaxID=1981511 RepID=A0A329QB81_9ACTN|nr:hypothetical protein [Phytoactinopolyspora halophila]AYY14760.1 hypothetical protein EF847_20740 [Actinobacteria bacterium YIM 96077]RAW09670.1 hypothetical protein DPM12_20590 [Phytoactinopolyspora halophila]